MGKIINLHWNEDENFVIGRCVEMTKEEFEKELIAESDTYEACLPEDIEIKREALISCSHSIPEGILIPMAGISLVIEDYWTVSL